MSTKEETAEDADTVFVRLMSGEEHAVSVVSSDNVESLKERLIAILKTQETPFMGIGLFTEDGTPLETGSLQENGCVNGTHLQGIILQANPSGNHYSCSAQTDYSDMDHPVSSHFDLTVNDTKFSEVRGQRLIATLSTSQQSSKGTVKFDGNKFTLTLSSSVHIKPDSSSHSGFNVTGLEGEFETDGDEGRLRFKLVGSGSGCHDGARGYGRLKKTAPRGGAQTKPNQTKVPVRGSN